MKQVYLSALKQYSDRLNHYGSQLSDSVDQYEMYYYRKLLLRTILKRNWVRRRLNVSK